MNGQLQKFHSKYCCAIAIEQLPLSNNNVPVLHEM